VRVIAPRLGNAALKVQTYRVGNGEGAFSPYRHTLAEVVRSEVGPYPDPLFPLAKEISFGRVPHRTIWISVFTPEDTRREFTGRDRDRRREAEVEAALSRGSLRCNRTEENKALGDELALV